MSIAVLFVMQGLTGQFVIQAVPVFLRWAGQSPALIGLVFLSALPYVLRFLWAPLVDRYGSQRHGRRRVWVLGAQLVVLAILGAMALLDPREQPIGIMILAAGLMTVLGTQLTAAGALAIELFDKAQYPRLAAVQAASAGLAGFLLGAGVLFALSDLGWQASVLGVLSISGLTTLLLWPEPLDQGRLGEGRRPGFLAAFALLRIALLRRLLLVAVLSGFGVALPYGLKPILQVDVGLDIAEIGLVGIVGGNAVGLLAALFMRPFVERFGGYRCLGALALAGAALAGMMFAVVVLDGLSLWNVVLFVLTGNALAFASFTAERSLAMPLCAGAETATRFATFVSLEGAAVLSLAALGTALSGAFGAQTVFALATAGSLAGAFWAFRLGVREGSKAP
ncbi:MFS transporter, putative signal transducer [Fulvimarina manganoxydans]|uniref:MFS transporter, putative signal transducer n=1 Tax=Fulvimarina manganoxydans TaxID=937218 RepID=A0A1W2ELJ3_9HYPH|nr:MFS transporter [Fulvimarina manganoxydans]SMD10587.1 MFS transporter, putative signal transducer [Fulvimarina manganoxydans]